MRDDGEREPGQTGDGGGRDGGSDDRHGGCPACVPDGRWCFAGHAAKAKAARHTVSSGPQLNSSAPIASVDQSANAGPDSVARGGRNLPPALLQRLQARGIAVDASQAHHAEEGGHPQPGGAEEPPLPPGWEKALDATYNAEYYFNRTTRERSWERPGAPAPEPHHPAGLPEGWIAATDPSTGATYYCNAALGLTQWNSPGGEGATGASPCLPGAVESPCLICVNPQPGLKRLLTCHPPYCDATDLRSTDSNVVRLLPLCSGRLFATDDLPAL